MATMILLMKLFPERQIMSYSYYLARTCQNAKIPTPVHPFTVGTDVNKQNIDVTSLKTGLPQNYWKDGHRRVVGEHLDYSGKIPTESIIAEYDTDAHKIDEKEMDEIIKLMN